MMDPHSSSFAPAPSSSLVFPVASLLLLGPTGSGKSPLGDLLSSRGLLGRRCHHLDFGSELRSIDEGTTVSRSYSPEERDFIRGVLTRGLLLENEHFPLAAKIIHLFLERVSFSQDDILVLNGIPRHTGQASDMARIVSVAAVIELVCTAEDVFCRLGTNIGGDRIARTDDHLELVEKKLALYHERTAPLREHYRQRGAAVYTLTVGPSTTAEEKYRDLSSLASADPPVSLVAEPPQG